LGLLTIPRPHLEDNAVETFISRLGRRVTGVLHGFDRLRFAGTQRLLANVAGLGSYLAHVGVLLKDFTDWAEHLTAEVRAASEAVMRDAGRPMIYMSRSSDSKEQAAEAIRRRDGIEVGPVCQLSAVEPLWGYEIRHDRASRHLVLQLRQRKCLHLYHYWVDEEVGLMHVRIPTWLPFGVKLCLNGREWMCRALDRAGIGYTRRDNCLTRVSDVDAAQAVLDAQLKTDWPALLDRLVSRSHPAWKTATATAPVLKLDGAPLDYYWSLEQSEWASDLMFRDAASLAGVYSKLIRHGITMTSCDSVLRYLGKRVDRRFDGQVQADLRRRVEGVRLKHSVNGNSVKMYDKQGSVLRVETTIHNPRDLRVYRGTEQDPDKLQWRAMRKGVADLFRRAQVSQASNERYLAALSGTDLEQTVAQTLAPVCKPVTRDGRRRRAIRPLHEPDMSLLKAVADGRWTINGFRNKDIRAAWLGADDPTDAAERKRRSGQVTRALGLLHAHGLIRKVSRTRRWMLTDKGRQVADLLQATQAAPASKLLAAA
jgi:hypothetical protein